MIDSYDFFAIRSLDSLTNYFILTPTTINTYRNINMNSNELSNVSGIKISGSDTSDYFIKTNGGIDTNTYQNPLICQN